MMKLLLSRFGSQLEYITELVRDIPQERMNDAPAPGVNTPAWILGHLCWAADLIPALVGKASSLDPSWKAHFSMKTKPSADGVGYPLKSVLIETLSTVHANATAAVKDVSLDQFGMPFPDPAFRHIIPTVADAVAHLLTTHEALHMGQLSAWRRVAGLPPIAFMQFA